MSSKNDDDFRNDPFRRLKGFRVPAEEERSAKSPPAAPHPTSPTTAPEPGGEELFAEEMERLGVARRSGDVERVTSQPVPQVASPPAPPKALTEQELFLAAVDGLTPLPREEDETAGGGGEAAPRRMRQLRKGELLPEAQLDLHGCDRREARQKVRFFLDDACYQGLRTVLVVTGRGNRSGGEAVLRDEIERYLAQEAGAWVVEWGRAPARFGGEGALVVFLRERRRAK